MEPTLLKDADHLTRIEALTAESKTGLDARWVRPAQTDHKDVPQSWCDMHNSIGDPARAQLGKYRAGTFELVAFGRTFSTATTMALEMRRAKG